MIRRVLLNTIGKSVNQLSQLQHTDAQVVTAIVKSDKTALAFNAFRFVYIDPVVTVVITVEH